MRWTPLGWATFALGDYDAADAHYRESLATFEKIGHQLGISLAPGWYRFGGMGSRRGTSLHCPRVHEPEHRHLS